MQVNLKVLQGSKSGKEIGIAVDRFVVGRNADCHLRPRSDLISRRHCEIVIESGEVRICDFGSRNGTYVNDERVDGECVLKPGDKLRIGRLEFEVLIDHSQAGLKRPAVKSVKEAVSRTADDHGKDKEDDVGAWLTEADRIEHEQQKADPDTRQFTREETDRVALDATAGEAETRSGESDESKNGTESHTETIKKKKPGKLPKRRLIDSRDSSEAASDMLKKMFNRH